ncbi:hypothetical protein Godav_008327 [Gossypium davidsonii]|uniref:Uncharacterized protein n=1 Tax=Gossypium davidsonii TaxID=34287 RepID=A0A7J8S9R5_GOSDV|nr:hypothetical protein [Gossypium davidsonii]
MVLGTPDQILPTVQFPTQHKPQTWSPKMEFTVTSPTKKQKQSLPPRRGQVKMRIIKGFFKSVTSIASVAKKMPSKMKESGPGFSSTSTTPAPTPTAYNSD